MRELRIFFCFIYKQYSGSQHSPGLNAWVHTRAVNMLASAHDRYEAVAERLDAGPGKRIFIPNADVSEDPVDLPVDIHGLVYPVADIPVKTFPHVGAEHGMKELVCQPHPKEEAVVFLLLVYRKYEDPCIDFQYCPTIQTGRMI